MCLENANVSGFHTTSDVPMAGNELVTTTATFAADIFQNNSGVPGAALGPLSMGVRHESGMLAVFFFGPSVRAYLIR